MSDLGGARVALLEARRGSELAGLVTRHGGVPISVPAVREAALPAAAAVSAFLDAFAAGTVQVAVFLTGAGAGALFEEADRLGRLAELRAGLGRVTVAVRGPKPAAALQKQAIPIALRAQPPHTTAELLCALAQTDLRGAGVALVHYGERSDTLSAALCQRGARLHELCLYEWLPPADPAPLRALVADLIAGRVDAVAFTSQVQARHLFQAAATVGQTDALREALNARVIVASLAPTCANALRALGVTPRVIPAHAKMGHLIAALAADIARRAGRGTV